MATLEHSPNWDMRKDNSKEDMTGFPYDEGFPKGAYGGKFYTLRLCNGELVHNCSVNDSREFSSEGLQWKARGRDRDRSAVIAWQEQERYFTGSAQ